MNQVLPLIGRMDVQAAQRLIESQGLRFEPDYDVLVGMFEGGTLMGCGARHGRVLKMLVVAEAFRGGNVLGEVVSALMRSDHSRYAGHYLIFSKPCAVVSFQRLGFRLLLRRQGFGMLEYRDDLPRFLREHNDLVKPGRNGALVLNSDYLSDDQLDRIAPLARQVEHLYLFLASADDPVTGVESNRHRVSRSIGHLSNVTVIDARYYALSSQHFPGYFLANEVDRLPLKVEMDVTLFAKHIAPFFQIDRYFLVDALQCRELRQQQSLVKSVLEEHAIELVDGEAFRGRSALKASRVQFSQPSVQGNGGHHASHT